MSSEGPFVAEFEDKIAALTNRQYAIAVSSGTAALDVAIASLDIGENDEVILPTFTIISCILQIVRSGAKPVFVDSDPITWNMRVDQIEKKITPRTKAILAVHIYGLPVDMDPLLEVARRHGLFVVEDAAEMIGQAYRNKPCGSMGDVSTFSFYSNKHVTTGEGGMVLTDSFKIAERCRSLRNLCFQPQQRFVHDDLGWNYRMTNLQAAVGLGQVQGLAETIARKREIGAAYQTGLAGLANIQQPLARAEYAENIYWVYGLVLRQSTGLKADSVMTQLAEVGVGTRPFFWPMHKQPVLRKHGFVDDEKFPVAEYIAEHGFYIPSGTGLTDAQIDQVIEKTVEVLE